MRHGYTNRTDLLDGEVHKHYEGPDAPTRLAAEFEALSRLAEVMPVPTVIERSQASLVRSLMVGEHGQDLIDAGRAETVLTGCGELLRRLHQLPPATLQPGSTTGVIRHGDFGPNNVLFDPVTMSVTALLDWEFSGIGDAIDDIAWCEWIVRMHHPAATAALPKFFEAYGCTPAWEKRRSAMVDRCHELEQFCRRWDPDGPGERQWRDRAVRTASWARVKERF
jgi:aminoglycoside phosphotransferase (APT) family kinase protein